MTKSQPFILEGSLSVDARMLIFAEDTIKAAEHLEEKQAEIRAFLEQQLHALALDAMMNPEQATDRLLYYFDVRPAEGREVAGTEALKQDEITLDTCTHEDHEHEED